MNIPVVIVDNAETDRYIAKRRFSRTEGFGQCVEYQSGLDFIKDFKTPEPDAASKQPTVVLMDISMPGKSGFEVIDEYLSKTNSESSSNIIFVLYTSSSASVDREQAAGMPGVSGYVQKPLNATDVLHIRDLAS